MEFESLTLALEGHFDKPLEELSPELRERVQRDFYVIPWVGISPSQRRSVAQQWDYQNDPAMEADRRYLGDFYLRYEGVKAKISKWQKAVTPNANNMRTKEIQLAKLNAELAKMDEEIRVKPGDYLATDKTETPKARAQRLAQRVQVEKVKNPKGFQIVVAREEGISVSRLKQIISPKRGAKKLPRNGLVHLFGFKS